MDAVELLSSLTARGVQLRALRDRLHLDAPKGVLTQEVLATIQAHKAEILELVELEGWPDCSREAVRRFREPTARLYPFLNRPVVTPAGRGLLLQVFTERVTVALNSDRGRVTFLLPSEVYPPEMKVPAPMLREEAN